MTEPVLQIPFDDAFRFDPSPTFAALRENRPVARVRTLAGAEVWLVTRYDDVKLVLADPRFSRAAVVKQGAPRVALAKPMPNSLTTTDPPEHSRLQAVGGANVRAPEDRADPAVGRGAVRAARRGRRAGGRRRRHPAVGRVAVADPGDLPAARRTVRGPRAVPGVDRARVQHEDGREGPRRGGDDQPHGVHRGSGHAEAREQPRVPPTIFWTSSCAPARKAIG